MARISLREKPCTSSVRCWASWCSPPSVNGAIRTASIIRRRATWTGGASATIGIKAYLLVQLPVMFVAGMCGIWLFYVQHQFDPTYWARRSSRERSARAELEQLPSGAVSNAIIDTQM